MDELTMQNKITSDIVLDLDISNKEFAFSTSIVDSFAQAEIEITELNETIESIKDLKPNCDKLDYVLSASSGALCGIIDIFLVGKPGESPLANITDKWFENRVKSFAKMCHPEGKNFDSLESSLRFLEKKFKIPYDQTGLGDAGKAVLGLNAYNHHFKSLAHNPSILGLFFSILDQFSNTSHIISDGQLISLQNAEIYQVSYSAVLLTGLDTLFQMFRVHNQVHATIVAVWVYLHHCGLGQMI